MGLFDHRIAPDLGRNPAMGQFGATSAPKTFYLKNFGIGLLLGVGLELLLIKSGYYQVMKDAQARDLASAKMDMEEYEAYLAQKKNEPAK
ncbi:hypothetical protein HK097_006426 [Rhizophlyctis rosea]|uniref:Uncharacterized protein n=1 Tax=Rhizophlyctis rosea TaxID=64517 RepID=A0AAD5SQS1_9FUNG|nr:hypothetical protein HK097_006426 [Rhizophlyctis rosea]